MIHVWPYVYVTLVGQTSNPSLLQYFLDKKCSAVFFRKQKKIEYQKSIIFSIKKKLVKGASNGNAVDSFRTLSNITEITNSLLNE